MLTKYLTYISFLIISLIVFPSCKENTPPDFEPKCITPKFVSDSIRFALGNGWEDGKMEIEYRNQKI